MRLVLTAVAAVGLVATAQAAEPGTVVPSRAVGTTHDCASFYPQLSQLLGEHGDVLLQYDVGADGSIANVLLKKTSGYDDLDAAGLKCVREAWRNEPATLDGKPIASRDHLAIVRFMGGPQTAREHLDRGRWYIDHGRYDDAIADFDVALGLDPTLKEAVEARADAVAAKAQNRPARIPWEPERSSQSPEPASEGQGHVAGAAAGGRDCVSYYPDLSRRLDESGDVMIKYDVDAAGAVANAQVVQSSGFDRLDQAALACITGSPSGTKGPAPGRMAIIRFSLRPSPSEYLEAGLKAESDGLHEQAIEAFTSAIAGDPENAEAYRARALVYDKLGKRDLAAADRAKADSLASPH